MQKPSDGDPFLKRVELWLRHVLVRRLKTSAPTTVVERPHNVLRLPERPKILLLRQDKIGDVLVSMPVFRLVRKAFPAARIDVLLGEANMPMSRAVLQYADTVHRYSKKGTDVLALARTLRREQYDVVIDLMDKSSATSSLLVAAVNATYAIGLAKENAEVYTHVVTVPDRTTTHVVERTARLLMPFGIDPQREDLSLEYPLSDEDIQRARAAAGPQQKPVRLGLNISGSSEERYWGRTAWIECIREVQRRFDDMEIVVFAAPHHAAEQAAITGAAGVRAIPIVPAFHDFAALLHECSILITPDTSVVHLAAAFHIPAVVLFPHADNAVSWGPYHSPHIVVAAGQASLASISVDDVLAAVEQLVEKV